MLKAGYGFEEILREFPSLTVEHIKAAGERLVTA